MADPIIKPEEPSQEFLDESNGQRLITTSVVLIVLTTLFVTLRFWSDKRRVGRWFLDDILIFVSYVLYMIQCAISIGMSWVCRLPVFLILGHFMLTVEHQ